MARFPRRDSDQQADALGWRPTGIAARAGVWSARHRKVAIWGWLAFVFASFAIGAAVGTKSLDNTDAGVGESGRADRTVRNAFPKHADEMVLVQSEGANARDPSFQATVADAQRRLSAVPHTQAFESPYSRRTGNISSDGRSALLRFQIAVDDTEVQDRVAPAIDAVAAVQKAHPAFTVGEFGDASSGKEIEDVVGDDFSKALITSLPITLLILLVAFGAVVAASVPLLFALTAVVATIGLIGPISHIGSGVDSLINEVILLIGLAVGVDYSMFYLRREREEREAGRSENASLAAAAATSGRAVMISGFTVMIAMSGMYLAGAPTFTSFATGTILVVAVAVLGSLTVLPAILSWPGDRVEKGGVPIISNMPWIPKENGVWSRVVDRVLRHPVIAMLTAGGLLVVLAIPAFSLHTANENVESLPQDLGAIQTYNKIQAAFPGGPIPAVVVVGASDVSDRKVQRAIGHLLERTAASDNFEPPVTTETNRAGTVERVEIPDSGRRERLELEQGAGRIAGRPHSGHPRAGAGRDRRRDRLHGRIEGLQRHAESHTCRWCSPSSSRPPSCCCCSHSARS